MTGTQDPNWHPAAESSQPLSARTREPTRARRTGWLQRLLAGACALAAATAHGASYTYTPSGMDEDWQGKPAIFVLTPEGSKASTWNLQSEWKSIADQMQAKLVVMDGGGSWDTSKDVADLGRLYTEQTSRGVEGASRFMVAYGKAGNTLARYARGNPNNLAGIAFIDARLTAGLAAGGVDRPLPVMLINSFGKRHNRVVNYFKNTNRTDAVSGSGNDVKHYRSGSSAWNGNYADTHYVRVLKNLSTDIPSFVRENLLTKVARWRTVEGDFTLRATMGNPSGLSRIEEPGTGREAFVYVPSKVRDGTVSGPVPMVMLFHGSSANGKYFMDATGWHQVAEDNNFIVYAPTAHDWAWDSSSYGDDILSVEESIERFTGSTGLNVDGTTYRIDAQRVYVYGFSSGSYMASQVAYDLPNLVAAAAPWAYVEEAPYCSGKSAAKAIPVWYGIGAEDYQDDGDSFLEYFRCLAGASTPSEKYHSAIGDAERIHTTIYGGGERGIEVRFSVAADVGHGNLHEHVRNVWNEFFSKYRKNSEGESELIGSSDGDSTNPVLRSGEPLRNLSGAQGSATYWTIEVPSGSTSLTVSINGGRGDVDLYLRAGSAPTTSTYDCAPYKPGNEETCEIDSPQAGTWHIMLHGYDAYSGVTLTGTVIEGPADNAGVCPAGSTIKATKQDAGQARYGTVFSSSLYQTNQASTHKPQPLEVTVTKSGAPVADCEVRWSTATGHGWIFPEGTRTNAQGKLRAFWTAGEVAAHKATATIALAGGGNATAQFTGSAKPSPKTRTNSVHIYYEAGSGPWTEFKVRVTPVTGPGTTYYSTLNWSGAYGGIQFDPDGGRTTVLFSVWDTGGRKAKIRNRGACNETVGFGGEGTGTSCRLRFPPAKYGAIAGLPMDYMLKPGDTYETHVTARDCGARCTDYDFTFRDITRGFEVSLGTQRYKADAADTGGSGFIEDWIDKTGDHCLTGDARTAYFHDIQAKKNGHWQKIKVATFAPNYVPTNNEICANYYFGTEGDRFLMSSGSTLVSRPVVRGGPFFSANPKLTLP